MVFNCCKRVGLITLKSESSSSSITTGEKIIKVRKDLWRSAAATGKKKQSKYPFPSYNDNQFFSGIFLTYSVHSWWSKKVKTRKLVDIPFLSKKKTFFQLPIWITLRLQWIASSVLFFFWVTEIKSTCEERSHGKRSRRQKGQWKRGGKGGRIAKIDHMGISTDETR